ncbi:AslA-specific sulfatase-maturating enzyme [Bacteroidales bacterium]|nr:AslA-specific sulfatase-maturating enzyme [Bacteroidales bacterium]
MNSKSISPFAKPLYVMLKPIGSVCNLACDYCYYLEKKQFYPEEKKYTMSDATLEKFTQEYLESQTMAEVLFTWHGGETLMRPISFYQKALKLQAQYGRGRKIDNCIQTNGTLLTDDWCKFFKDNNFLVGISIDGPQIFHDKYRRSKQGQASFYQVMKGVELLKKHGVEYNGMAVVNNFNVDYPIEFYNFFKQIDCRYIQFAPIVERINKQASTKLTLPQDKDAAIELAPFSVSAKKWGDFLCAIFDEWVRHDVGKFYVQIFDATLANWVGEQPGICTMAKTCGHAGVMEFNGDVFSCDHYVFPEYKLGNINTKTIAEMMYSEQQLKFGNDKYDKLPTQCRECIYLFACNGECPKNRFLHTSTGEPGLNYLCQGFYQYFEHVAAKMDFMKNELLNKRAPANVML